MLGRLLDGRLDGLKGVGLHVGVLGLGFRVRVQGLGFRV